MTDLLRQSHRFFRRDTELGILIGHIDLQKDLRRDIFFGRLLLDLLCQMQRIHRMNQHNLIDDVLYFVCLQMSDHMPADRRADLLIFLTEFLHIILPVLHLTGLYQSLNILQRLHLTDCHQRDFPGVSARFLAGSFDIFLYICQILL